MAPFLVLQNTLYRAMIICRIENEEDKAKRREGASSVLISQANVLRKIVVKSTSTYQLALLIFTKQKRIKMKSTIPTLP